MSYWNAPPPPWYTPPKGGIQEIEETMNFLSKMKDFMKKEEEDKKKDKKDDKKPQGLTKGELALLLIGLSPVVGWLYSSLLLYAYSGMTANLQHLVK